MSLVKAGLMSYICWQCRTELVMRKVTAREANQNFAKLLAEVAAGERVVITKRGQEIAEMAPVSAEPRPTATERQARIDEFVRWLREGVEFPESFEFNRDEIYDR